MLVRTPQDLGHLVRDARTRRAFTQARLADAVGVSRKWLIDLEAGKPAAELSLVLRTLRVLGVELDAHDVSDSVLQRDAIDLGAIVNAVRPTRRRPRAR